MVDTGEVSRFVLRQMHFCVVGAMAHLHLGARQEYSHFVAHGATCPAQTDRLE